MLSKLVILWSIFTLSFLLHITAQPVVFKNSKDLLQIGGHLELYTDKGNSLTIEQARQQAFKASGQEVPNLQITPYTQWARFSIHNESSTSQLMLEVEYPIIDDITLFEILPDGQVKSTRLGEFTRYKDRGYDHQNYQFRVNIPVNETRQYYLKVKAGEQLQLPIYLGAPNTIAEKNNKRELIFGIYVGVALAMIFYNLFIYVSTRDNSYLIYVSYIVFTALTQVTLQGYSFRFLYPNSPWLAIHATALVPVLNGLAAVTFIQQFLSTKENFPIGNKILNIILVMYMVVFIPTFLGMYDYAQILVQLDAFLASVMAFIVALRISSRGVPAARFFLLAWSIFLASVVIFVLRNFNVLPYNNFTYYALQIGSALEVLLLSFALAHKINVFKAEKEASQQMALAISQENERLVREQNIILETKVRDRTEDLQATNLELNTALTNLKDAQTQLVEKEKMASLGQLTAGIAHEINNPINFVTSNIKPLKLDIADLKELLERYGSLNDSTPDIPKVLAEIESFKKEIDIDYIHEEITSLIKGIEDGATRTAEIVKGLRTFSRLDESDVKSIDIHEGLDSTLVLLRNAIPSYVSIVKEYGNLPKIECYAGKINQVFMNIFSNALNAIKSKKEHHNESITIKTALEREFVIITIKDTGIGMSESVREKIFDPFFTTKDVGEGTGLGLSIVFSIIEKHKGKIIVNSAPGEGAEFIIYLPLDITNHLS
ncbi:sensor histidine kinase [Chitinophaga polysaccharea]|uniref:sensor histidine kinase n=1 Tax=Chitinophaga TaxID=79328 RepID=UPI0014556362|nr:MULTISPECIES: 7TM diverse intracellular signaling domain-containing protein [Chitinophaga]NLR62059.1 sensor histidine kinase [Chitinophaga polysaccharea]NLU94608.1 sensor histidine kinase [Chitinophaga sp. Ak27]